ncbi:Transcriptional protein SWT1 [Geodia barretti]|uniref:Transcriptional protein SWT1 n=1 Tax=Geodia barretti TaxID=519541 RepID=A0AA35WFI6_GEOBA|nr:Transcriptional protein SWT1 [Geodia barretti]
MSKKSPWVRAKSSSHPGRYYYFNRETRASTWDPPPGFDGTVIPSLPRKERVNKNRGGEVADVRSSEQPLQDAWSQPAPTADENGSAGGKKNLQKANKEHGVGSVTTVSGRNRTTEKRTWVKQAAAKEAMDRATDMEEAMEVERWGEEEEVAMDIDVSQEDIAEMKLVRSSPSAPCQFHIESFGIPADYANDYSDKLYLVLDTNVLLSHLNFLEELKDYAIKGVGKPVLVIPWIVMQELDKHKSRGNDRLAGKARKAIRLLFSCFTSNHHRVRCQTMEETQTEVNNVSIANNDDRILHCCLLYQTKTQGHSGIVVLFSNDINLCSKALGNGVKAADRTTLFKELRALVQAPPQAPPPTATKPPSKRVPLTLNIPPAGSSAPGHALVLCTWPLLLLLPSLHILHTLQYLLYHCSKLVVQLDLEEAKKYVSFGASLLSLPPSLFLIPLPSVMCSH